MNHIKIKKVELSQWEEELDRLDRLAFPNIDPYYKKGAFWWAATVYGPWGETTAGFGGLKELGMGVGFLCRAYVAKEFNRAGIHRRLIKVRERYAKKLKLRKLITYTHPLNVKSANNLLACGFKLYTPVKPFGVEGALYFYKTLLK